MKKLLTICLLIVTAFTVNAQVKPTKEQTLAYLTKTFSLSEGQRFVDQFNERVMLDSNSFNLEKIVIKTSGHNENGAKWVTRSENTGFEWESITSIEISSNKNIQLSFNSKFKQIEYSKDYKEGFIERNEDFLELFIIETKLESFKKALERLVEIAKEENKDPFQN